MSLRRSKLLRWVLQSGVGPVIALLVALSAGTTFAQETDEEEDNATGETDGDIEQVIVTGTRLPKGDVTARVVVIDSDDIAMQGLTSFEDVIRSLPQNFSTINSSNNLHFGSDLLDANLGALGLGAATANLRGFGSENTLVLVNGKRLAGISSRAGQLGANLNDIPIAAIERVEISLDGGSAVYGSDAVAGVINVITKRDYRGATAKVGLENSSTGGHGQSASLYVATGWDTGTVSATISKRYSDPVSTTKTGYTSNDYSDRYGGDPRYNFKYAGYARSGAVAFSRWGSATHILPIGNDGRNAQPDDFVTYGPDDYLDIIPKDIGGSSNNRSIISSVIQSFGEREQLQLRADLLYSQTKSASEVSTFGFGSILIPASNAFNNFGQGVYVSYYADTEVELGLLPHVEQKDEGKQLRYVLTASYKISDELRVELDYTKSESGSIGDQLMFAPPSTRVDDEARYARLTHLIESSDPNEALNLFGDGTGQNPTIREFYRSFANDNDETHTLSIEPKISGEVFNLPGGKIGYVFGIEEREQWIETPGDDFNEEYLGTSRPTSELTAYFMESTVPLVGSTNSRQFLEHLVLSMQLRFDNYSIEGSAENDESGNPIFSVTEFSNTVKRLGLFWRPSKDVFFQLSRSEAFRAPQITSLYGGTQQFFDSNFVYDPLQDPPWVPARQSWGPNPDLLPEDSTNWTFSMEWTPSALDGLEIKTAWSSINLTNQISSGSRLSGLLPVEVYGNLPEFFIRDEQGNLIEARSTSVNIARRADERLDLEVSYRFSTDFGTIRPRLIHHRVLDMFDEAVPGSGEFSFFGKSIGVDKYKTQGNVSVLSGRLVADLWIRHTPGYINNDHERAYIPLPNEPVDSYTTVDLTAAYEMDNGLMFRFGGRNIFDADFPFMLSSSRRPYDSTRVNVRKRVLFFEVKYELGQGEP